MRNIHPLYIIVLLIGLIGFFVYNNHTLNYELNSQKRTIAAYESLGKDIVTYKKSWGQKKVVRRIDTLLKNSYFKNLSIQKQKRGKNYIVNFTDAEKKHIDYFFKKIMNGYFLVKSFSINKNKKGLLDMQMELQL